MPDGPPATGLRARKKRQTRATLLTVAEELFESRGYENVTVAEIADGANVSVKTLFTYFRSKEDLAFGDEGRLRDQILAAIAEREPDVTPVEAVADLLDQLIVEGSEGAQDPAGFHRIVGDSAALQSRLRRMWEEYEDALAAMLAEEIDGPTPAARAWARAWARLAACQIVAMVRSLTSPEVLALVGRHESPARQRKELQAWLATAAGLLSDGLGEPALNTLHTS